MKNLDLKPKYAGYYKLGGDTGVIFYLGKKPLWINRKLTSIFLGWEWFDDSK